VTLKNHILVKFVFYETAPPYNTRAEKTKNGHKSENDDDDDKTNDRLR
jgi:hypothetical protein